MSDAMSGYAEREDNRVRVAAVPSRYAVERAEEPTRAELEQRERRAARSDLADVCDHIEHRFALVEDEPTPEGRFAADMQAARARRDAAVAFVREVDAAFERLESGA